MMTTLKRNFLVAASAVALLTTTACVRHVDVNHQGPAQMTADVRTYAVLDHPVGSTMSTKFEFQQRIHAAMAKKGYQQAAVRDADILVSFKTLVMPIGNESGVAEGEEASLMATTTGAGSAQDVHKVVLVMLEEAETDKVVWVGWTSGEFRSYEVISGTRDSVEEILARIPKRQS